MTSQRLAAAIGLIVLVALCSGCTALETSSGNGVDDAEEEPDPEAVFEGIYVHSDDLEDVSGTVTTEITDGNQTVGEREEVQERPYVDFRSETLESSYPDEEGIVFVSNGTTNWWYYPDLEYAEYSVPEDAPFESEEVRSDRADTADEQLEKHDLEYRGTEEIADRETHVLDVEAKNESVERGISVLVGDTEYVYALETVDIEEEEHFRIVEQTVWIDTEYDYPLKEEVVWEGPDGERIEMTERFESVSFNDGRDDDTFDFEPPEGTEVSELEFE